MGRPKRQPQQAHDSTTAAFLTWLKKNNVQHPHCTIGWLHDTGRGVVAAKNMKAGDLVVEVPDDAVCMVENCCIAEQLEEASLAKATAVDPMQEVQGLILAVMAERHKGKASRWKEYLEFIPSDMSHMPMYWSEDEQRELRGTAALDKMEGKVQMPADAPTQVQVAWEDVAKPFIEKHKELKVFPRDETACWELYRWATAAVASYSFILGDEHYQAMVPFWDALNHITGKCNILLAHHERRGKGGALQMFATRDIAAGEEVVNNYGELSQAELLRAYGYVETHPEAEAHAHVQVPLRFIVQAAQAEEAAHMQHEHHQQQHTGTQSGGPSSEQHLPQGKGCAGAEAGKAEEKEGGGCEEEDSEGLSEFGLGGSDDFDEGFGDGSGRGADGTGRTDADGAAGDAVDDGASGGAGGGGREGERGTLAAVGGLVERQGQSPVTGAMRRVRRRVRGREGVGRESTRAPFVAWACG